ncbi:MAG: TraR/DksA C4-type zinc finger protein [Rubrobacteraceae bacterium]
MANTQLDEQFVEKQRTRLEELKEELLDIRRGMEEDERDRSQEEQDTELDSGDESQQMFTREMDATIGEQTERRLQDVERALAKVEEGSYGVCDDTGEEIAKGRLEAMPEAIRTVEAQQSFERERRPAGGGEV